MVAFVAARGERDRLDGYLGQGDMAGAFARGGCGRYRRRMAGAKLGGGAGERCSEAVGAGGVCRVGIWAKVKWRGAVPLRRLGLRSGLPLWNGRD